VIFQTNVSSGIGLRIPADLGTRTGHLGKQSGVPGQPWERSDQREWRGC
jgi:hypothetical protein